MRIVLLLNSVYYYCRKVVEDPVRPSGGVMGGGKISPCDTDTGTDRRKKNGRTRRVGSALSLIMSNQTGGVLIVVPLWWFGFGLGGSFYIKGGGL